MKTKINKDGTYPPYNHLQPIVDLLIANGNESRHPETFYPTKDGWLCSLKKKIDFDLLRDNLEIPESIKLDEEDGSIFDTLAFIEIRGSKD
jgi:hypothetical protein